jgi:hypothetical protein
MKLVLSLVTVAAMAGPFVALAAPAAGVVACGGIGADQRRVLAQESSGANLALEFFVAGHGDFVSGVDVSVKRLDRGGAEDALHVSADGPLCYARLAPGRYEIDATLNGALRSARATVPGTATRPVHVAIAFPEEAVRGDLDIRPTPEEKQEARTP